MQWKLSQDTASKQRKDKKPQSQTQHRRDYVEPTVGEVGGISERSVPHPDIHPSHSNKVIHDTASEEDKAYHEKDMKLAMSPTQMFISENSMKKNQGFVKLWDARTAAIQLQYFKKDLPDQSQKTQSWNLEAHFQTQVKAYFRRYPDAIYENIWYDLEQQEIFSNAQTYCTGLDPIKHSFCTTKRNFINQTWNGISSEMGRMLEDMVVSYKALGMRPAAYGVSAADITNGKCYGDIIFPDMRFGLCPAVNNLANQDSVIIIGGGPSTNRIDFSAFKDIPVWTMNNYYKNPIFDQFNNIQVACFLDEVDVFDNEDLWNYVNSRDTIVFQEITDYGCDRINYVKNRATYSTFFHTRYRSKLGVGPRLMIAAILLGIRNIYFCGFDGYSVDTNNNHSFEEGKSIPNWMKNSKNPQAVQRQQYAMLWDYILNNLKLARPFKMIDLAKLNNIPVEYEFLQGKIR